MNTSPSLTLALVGPLTSPLVTVISKIGFVATSVVEVTVTGARVVEVGAGGAVVDVAGVVVVEAATVVVEAAVVDGAAVTEVGGVVSPVEPVVVGLVVSELSPPQAAASSSMQPTSIVRVRVADMP